MSRRNKLFCATGFIAMWTLTFTAFCGDLEWECRRHCPCDQYSAHTHTLLAAIFSALPPAWIVATAMTGFYEHGFRWGVAPTFQRAEP